jgi:hypothetical protein
MRSGSDECCLSRNSTGQAGQHLCAMVRYPPNRTYHLCYGDWHRPAIGWHDGLSASPQALQFASKEVTLSEDRVTAAGRPVTRMVRARARRKLRTNGKLGFCLPVMPNFSMLVLSASRMWRSAEFQAAKATQRPILRSNPVRLGTLHATM